MVMQEWARSLQNLVQFWLPEYAEVAVDAVGALTRSLNWASTYTPAAVSVTHTLLKPRPSGSQMTDYRAGAKRWG